jgi:hypothetical protein
MQDFLIRTTRGECGTYLHKEDIIKLIEASIKHCQSVNAMAELYLLIKSIENGKVDMDP